MLRKTIVAPKNTDLSSSGFQELVAEAILLLYYPLASEQGNVIGSVRICVYKKNCN